MIHELPVVDMERVIQRNSSNKHSDNSDFALCNDIIRKFFDTSGIQPINKTKKVKKTTEES